ncbi:MAG: hypothetical protein ACK4M8_11005 [Allorhizobium sp.]
MTIKLEFADFSLETMADRRVLAACRGKDELNPGFGFAIGSFLNPAIGGRSRVRERKRGKKNGCS